MKNILLRLTGLITIIILGILMVIPFIVIFVIFGIEKANVIHSYIFRIPMNLLGDDKVGDLLFKLHKKQLDEKIKNS